MTKMKVPFSIVVLFVSKKGIFWHDSAKFLNDFREALNCLPPLLLLLKDEVCLFSPSVRYLNALIKSFWAGTRTSKLSLLTNKKLQQTMYK